MIFAPGVEARPTSADLADAGAAARGHAETTRQRITAVVSESGPITAGELAKRLGLTPAAVRRHLDILAEDGLVEEHEKAGNASPRGRGRPARAYVLTEAGHSDLNDDYRDLASEVLHYLAAHGGDEAVAAFARQRAQELADHIPDAVRDASIPLTERAHGLAAALRREGFAASARPVGEGTPLSGVQLCQGHCPVRDVAAEFPQLCDAETEMFSDLLGVHVQRLATQAQGDHVCTTFVPLTTNPEHHDSRSLGSAAESSDVDTPPRRETR